MSIESERVKLHVELISNCIEIVKGYKAKVLASNEAFKLLGDLEKKAYENDPTAEPDGDYTYTVALAMKEINTIEDQFEPMEFAAELKQNLVSLMALHEAINDHARAIGITWQDANGEMQTYWVDRNINLATFVINESQDIRQQLEEVTKKTANEQRD